MIKSRRGNWLFCYFSADESPFLFNKMAITREQKQNILKDLADKFNRAKAAILVDFNKLSVAKTMELRRVLKQIGAEYKVAKKTLINRVLKTGDYKGANLDELKTQVGVIFSYEDPVLATSSLYKFSRLNEALKILGGFLGLEWSDRAKIIEIAKLPPREVLIGQVVRTIAMPLSGLVTVLSGNMRNLVNLLNNLKTKRS